MFTLSRGFKIDKIERVIPSSSILQWYSFNPLSKFNQLMHDQKLSEDEKIEYDHMCRLSDSNIFALLEDYFAEWYPEESVADSVATARNSIEIAPTDDTEMVPFFHFIAL